MTEHDTNPDAYDAALDNILYTEKKNLSWKRKKTTTLPEFVSVIDGHIKW